MCTPNASGKILAATFSPLIRLDAATLRPYGRVSPHLAACCR
jgi:hypothetical protein